MSERIYSAGRSTDGWQRGRKILDVAQVKPGDVLINVCHQFQAENLIRVLDEPSVCPGFTYEYADPATLQRSDGRTMFAHEFELGGQRRDFYRAIDRRPRRRFRRIRNLPSWLSYGRTA